MWRSPEIECELCSWCIGGKDGKVKKERYKNKKDKSGTSHIQETIWTNRKVGNTWTPP